MKRSFTRTMLEKFANRYEYTVCFEKHSSVFGYMKFKNNERHYVSYNDLGINNYVPVRIARHKWTCLQMLKEAGFLVPESLQVFNKEYIDNDDYSYDQQSEKINDFVSQWFCAFPLFSDNRPYRPYHLAHHRFTESENDPDLSLSAPFPITKASFRRKVIRDLTGQTGFKRYSIALKSIFSSEADNFAGRIKKISDKISGFFISNLVIFSLIAIFSHWSIYFLLWWIPAFTYYSLIVRIRNIAEHSVTPGDTNLNNTRTTKASLLTRYLLVPHHVNFHLEHHLFTNCPWYNLPKVHEMLKGEPLRDKMCIEESYFSVLRKATSG
mgnify:CR=1 FL=1